MRSSKFVVVLATVLISVVIPAHGAVITFDFTGVINRVDSPLAGTFSNGQLIAGSYTFDTSSPDTDPADPTVGLYSSISAYAVAAGSFASTGSGFQFNVFDNLILGPGVLRDQYRAALGTTGPAINGLSYNGFTLDLFTTSSNPTALVSDALPSSPPNIGDFANNELRFYFIDPSSPVGVDYVVGSLSTLTNASVPEPTSLAIFGFGISGMWIVGRRKKKLQVP